MKIFCIGRNYTDHATELNNPVPEEPLFFFKPDSALLQKNKPFYYPNFSNEIHYELELVVRINRIGKHIAKRHAHKYYDEVGVGIDFTARDIQQECKSKGLPWDKAKGFDGSAPVSKFVKLSALKKPVNELNFSLKKNGEVVQKGRAADMIFSVDHLINYLSRFFTMKIGDLVFTGTPKGVGAVKIGDRLTGYLEGEEMLKVPVK